MFACKFLQRNTQVSCKLYIVNLVSFSSIYGNMPRNTKTTQLLSQNKLIHVSFTTRAVERFINLYFRVVHPVARNIKL
jgi:hypothetical protein